MSAGELAVLLYRRHVASLHQSTSGARWLEYTEDPGATPVSLAMPLQVRRHKNRVVEPYLNGLLPDRDNVRQEMGREFGVSGNNPFELLRHVGLDCAGAIQFCDPDRIDEVLNRQAERTPVSDSTIANRIDKVMESGRRSWIAASARWSLAGAQAKFALHRDPVTEQWFEPQGSLPSTHIVKPGVADLLEQALNEHVCMRAAKMLGIPVALTQYVEFQGRPAIVVERFDRGWTRGNGGALLRIHQEDVCQAMSVAPDKKYEMDGGPSAVRVLRLLEKHTPPDSRQRFVESQVFNYLIGGTDAHAKNLSIILAGSQARLAPLYDVASGFPYVGDISQDLPMAVAGERRFGRIQDRHWAEFAKQARIDPGATVDLVHRLAGELPSVVEAAFDELAQRGPDGSELRDKMLRGIEHQCSKALGG